MEVITSDVLNVVPIIPKIKMSNWEVVLCPIVKQMLFNSDIEYNSVLLISKIRNATNGDLQTNKITIALKNIILQSGKFNIVKQKQLNDAYTALGLIWEDNLESCSKAIGLGRYLKAKYLLYGVVRGDVNHPIVDLQLILVKTGEVIWLFKDFI